MRQAVIVSTARTPIGKAYRGAFNNTEAPTLGGHAVRHAVSRAGLDPAEVEDVIMGCALPQGSQGQNIAQTDSACCRAAGNDGWYDGRSTVLVRHDGDRGGREDRHSG